MPVTTDAVQHETIGSLLRYLRQRADCTLAECAKAAGVSAAYLSAIERNARKPFGDDKIHAVLSHLGFGIGDQIKELARQCRLAWRKPADLEKAAAVEKMKQAGDAIVACGGINREAWDAAVTELKRLGVV